MVASGFELLATRRLGELLVDMGAISEETVSSALEIQAGIHGAIYR